MDNLVNESLSTPALGNTVQRLALGSLYLSLLFVLLSVSFVAPTVSSTTNSASLFPEAGTSTPTLGLDGIESVSTEG